jgi:hypothetical protein
VKKMDKVDESGTDKSEWIKLECFKDLDNPASRYSQYLAIFKDGFPEECIKWVMSFREIEILMPLKNPTYKIKMFPTF